MSSVVVLQTYDQIFIGADSAVSAMLDDGTIYRLPQTAQKLFVVDDMVIFCAGTLELCDRVMNLFTTEPSRTLEKLQQIALAENRDYLARHPAQNKPGKLQLEIVIGKIENGQSIVYSISPQDDHQLRKRVLQDATQYAIWTGGIKTREANEKAFSTFGQTLNVFETLQQTFNHISFEGVGGELNVYRIDRNGIQHVMRTPIVEKPKMKELSDLLEALDRAEMHLIVAETVVGQLGNFVTMEIGSGNNVTKINTNGISAGHADFNSAPFRLDMKGNLVANSLTANYAKIFSSNFSDGEIVGSSINVGNGQFTVDRNGNMYAGNGRFRGTIDGTTFTGGLIRTAASGRRIELDQRGFRAIDSSGTSRISIQTDSDQGIAGIGFNDASGSWQGQIIATTSDFSITAKNGLYFSGGVGPITFASKAYFNQGAIGLDMSSISGLSTELNSLTAQIRDKADINHTHTEYGVSLAFDPTTRNLKLYNRNGATLATVNIPK